MDETIVCRILFLIFYIFTFWFWYFFFESYFFAFNLYSRIFELWIERRKKNCCNVTDCNLSECFSYQITNVKRVCVCVFMANCVIEKCERERERERWPNFNFHITIFYCCCYCFCFKQNKNVELEPTKIKLLCKWWLLRVFFVLFCYFLSSFLFFDSLAWFFLMVKK